MYVQYWVLKCRTSSRNQARSAVVKCIVLILVYMVDLQEKSEGSEPGRRLQQNMNHRWGK
jgi:hypothetical protein